MGNTLKVLCVLKSGGDYGPEYVDKLAAMVRRNLRIPYEFVCLTDMPVKGGVEFETECLKGWWAKLEVFRFTGPCVYFDLDTVIVDRIDALSSIRQERCFYMLQPFNPREAWASGLMAWNGDFRFLYDELNRVDIDRFRWDQRYISAKMKAHKERVQPFNSIIPGIASYKHHCKEGIPDGARIVCFHGHPRPHEAPTDEVTKHWSV